ncbi:MAG: hypothetical protein OXH34_08075 [Bacteroidetes bacterium]|nr:hypothetical protein [Bacteroidota bacterium]
MKLATIDVGTNSAKLLISELTPSGKLEPLVEEHRMIRLGEGVDAHGILRESAIERLVQALQGFRSTVNQWQVERCVVAGTSASRDTGNKIVTIIRERTGLHYEILSGEQEADLSYEGAVAGLPNVAGRIVTCDIGGGSTEIVEGMPDGRILQRFSLDVGSVRITERYFSSQPPDSNELKGATGFIKKSLSELPFSGSQTELLVGASDVHRLLLELQHELSAGELPIKFDRLNPNWRRLQVKEEHPDKLSCTQVKCWLELLTRMTMSDVLALNPRRLHGRADVFPAAILIFLEVMNMLRQESITVSPWGLCHGMALRIFKTGAIK